MFLFGWPTRAAIRALCVQHTQWLLLTIVFVYYQCLEVLVVDTAQEWAGGTGCRSASPGRGPGDVCLFWSLAWLVKRKKKNPCKVETAVISKVILTP